MKKTYFWKTRFTIQCVTLITILFINNIVLHAQTLPLLKWSKTYEGIYSDIARQIMPTNDGGFVMVGESESYGPGIISTLLIKCDSTGVEEWSKTYGGSAFDLPTSVIQTTDNGFLIATYTTSFPPEGTNIRLIKTDPAGETLWTSVIPNSNGCLISLSGCVVQTPDVGYLIAGYGWKDPNCNQIMLFKVNASGEAEWFKEIGGFSDDYGANIQLTNEGNIILAGYTFSYGNGLCDGYLLKLDQNGETIWTSVTGGTDYDSYRFVRPTSDGGYIAVGSTQSFGKGEQGFVVKTDADGLVQWTAAHGGNINEGFEGVVETANHDFLLSGSTNSYGNGEHDFLIMRIDAAGALLGMETYGGSNEDFGSTIEIMANGDYIAAASNWGDTFLDFQALCFEADSIATSIESFAELSSSSISFDAISPNPVTNQARIDFYLAKPSLTNIQLLNLNGSVVEELFSESLSQGEHTIVYTAGELKPGIYLCRIQTDDSLAVKKMIKIR
ncbi:MAG: T9SS type A sorting domain-containing protein [Lentimicrobium sp.]|jgi:hypothetical protein|nr:T9SS type A sorting domain-containing protein [Lentimicrobium sp.]